VTRYAENTSVPVEKSRAEIERVLHRYGCEAFAYRTDRRTAQVAFSMNHRMLRFDLILPNPLDEAFTLTPSGRERKNPDAVTKAWEQACRQRWRALALVIKAKLEAVESEITTFEQEFLANIIMPGGQLFHEIAVPKIAVAYETGKMPLLLGPGS
jgi:hypothetical protein